MRRSRRKPRPAEALARLAAKRYGLVTRADALAAGLSREQIARRVRNGELIRIYRDVYRVAAAPSSWHQAALAPCLRLPGFVWVSGATAGRFWALDGCEGNEIEVITTCKLRRIDDVTIHQVADIAPRHVTVVRHIPVTTVHRTICDLGMAVPPNIVELALESALRRRITTIDRLWRTIEELGTKGRRGTAVLAEILRGHSGRPTESALESKCAQFFRRFRFPRPTRQLRIRDEDGFVARVDFIWQPQRVILEVDSRSHHLRREQWEADLRRRNALTAKGFLVLHVTYERLLVDAAAVAHEIERALSRA
jgi:very-short-patch-repair endonuclease